jgi:hypothetical protein
MNTTRTTRIAVVAVSALLVAGTGFGSSAQATRIDAGGGSTTADRLDPAVYVAQRKTQMAADYVTYAAARMRAAAAYRTTVGRPAPDDQCQPMPDRKYASHPPLLICRISQ